MSYPLLDVFLTMMWFFLAVLWVLLMFRILLDLFQDYTLSGWAKAAWTLLLIALPFLGVLIYVIVRERKMAARDLRMSRRSDPTVPSYAGQAVGGAPAVPSRQVAQLTRLAAMKDSGEITEEEYRHAKERVLM